MYKTSDHLFQLITRALLLLPSRTVLESWFCPLSLTPWYLRTSTSCRFEMVCHSSGQRHYLFSWVKFVVWMPLVKQRLYAFPPTSMLLLLPFLVASCSIWPRQHLISDAIIRHYITASHIYGHLPLRLFASLSFNEAGNSPRRSELDRMGDCSDTEVEAFGCSRLSRWRTASDARRAGLELALLTTELELALVTPKFELADCINDDLAAFGCSRCLVWFELELDELALFDFFLVTIEDIYKI